MHTTPVGAPARPIPTQRRSLQPLALFIVGSWIGVFGTLALWHALAAVTL